MECKSEEESVALVRLLPTTQASLLDWAVNLMADVVQQEAINKMNSHNIAMVFAPNMTQVINQPTPPPPTQIFCLSRGRQRSSSLTFRNVIF